MMNKSGVKIIGGIIVGAVVIGVSVASAIALKDVIQKKD